MKGVIALAALALLAGCANLNMFNKAEPADKWTTWTCDSKAEINWRFANQARSEVDVRLGEIEEALSAFDEEQQRAACLEVAQSLFRRYAELPRREGRAKLSQALARRGFGWDAIESTVDQLFE